MSHSEDSSSNESEESESSNFITNTEQGDFIRSFNRSGLDEILKDPKCTDDHKGILDWIKKEKLCLYSKEDKDKENSLIKILLEEVCNGHEVVEKVLDSYMDTTCLDPNSKAFSIEMNFTGLMLNEENKQDSGHCACGGCLPGLACRKGLLSWFRKDSGSGDSVLNDIVELKLKYQENFWDHYTNGFKGKKENCSKSFLGK